MSYFYVNNNNNTTNEDREKAPLITKHFAPNRCYHFVHVYYLQLKRMQTKFKPNNNAMAYRILSVRDLGE